MISNVDARMVFMNSIDAFAKAFPGLDRNSLLQYGKLTQSTYRFEVPLLANNTHYVFNVLSNEQVFFATELRLKQQDSAVVYQLGVFTGQPLTSATTDAAFLPDCYPNTQNYGASAQPMQALYNGYLKITVNNDILVPNWDLLKHLYVPETQQTAALGAGSPQDEHDGGAFGFYPVEPNIVLIGSKSNVIEINLPTGITSVSANSRLIVIARCITAQNTTVVS